MNPEIYDDMALEQNIKTHFGLPANVQQVIARAIPVSRTARASVFLTEKKELMVYIDAQARLTLGDVKKFISRMGLSSELYLPPKSQPTYFDDVAKSKFKATFPGRNNPSDTDLIYYRTLAPYQPALVQIHAVKNGEIYQFDTDSNSGWRLATKFAYRRIRTS